MFGINCKVTSILNQHGAKTRETEWNKFYMDMIKLSQKSEEIEVILLVIENTKKSTKFKIIVITTNNNNNNGNNNNKSRKKVIFLLCSLDGS